MNRLGLRRLLKNPVAFGRWAWPEAEPYRQQRQIEWSVERNHVTMVPAGNMLGKDWIAGRIAISFFTRNRLLGRTCRVVTTSVKDDHLRVLWGEIGRWV